MGSYDDIIGWLIAAATAFGGFVVWLINVLRGRSTDTAAAANVVVRAQDDVFNHAREIMKQHAVEREVQSKRILDAESKLEDLIDRHSRDTKKFLQEITELKQQNERLERLNTELEDEITKLRGR